ncbi:MAG: 6-phosphofructokinase [Clostridia bacterium]|nr:6-phosphofructokinase [Clostridia bacterium]
MKKLIGNAIVGQSGGPTSAINATLAGVIRGALSSECIRTIYGMRNGIEGFLAEDILSLNGIFESEDKLKMLEHTPAAALGSCRKKLPTLGAEDSVYERIVDIFKKYDIRYFFYIGGNDSMDTVAKLSEYMGRVDYKVRIVGVPKTIDNDLFGTDHTPGYGTAAKYIATTVEEIVRDCSVYKIPAVTVVEIMGRNAGWLTAAADVARFVGGESADLAYFPERDFDMERFLRDVEDELGKKPNVVVAVSEGARFADGRYVGEGHQSGAVDVFGHKYLAGAGRVLEDEIKRRFGCKVRSIELSLPQRCAAHIASATDLCESVAIGRASVKAACEEGVSGEMMVFERMSDEPYTCAVGHKSVAEIANANRMMPEDFINEDGNGVTEACARYILPLIEGEAYPEYKSGVPVYLRF